MVAVSLFVRACAVGVDAAGPAAVVHDLQISGLDQPLDPSLVEVVIADLALFSRPQMEDLVGPDVDS